MKTYSFCPVTERRINERKTRVNAIITLSGVLLFIFTGWVAVPVFLVVDFLLRTGRLSKYSPVNYISGLLVKLFLLQDKYINAGPKIFAARVGFALISLALLSYFISIYGGIYLFLGILGFFTFLEGVFGICVACIIYPYLYRFLYKKEPDIIE